MIFEFAVIFSVDAPKTEVDKWLESALSQAQTVQVDDKELEKIINEVLTENPKAVEDYKKGKETVIMFLVGMAMKELKGKAKAEVVKEKNRVDTTDHLVISWGESS